MNFGLRIIICSFFVLLLTVDPGWARSLNVKAAVVMDMQSGKILYEQKPHQKIPPASLTKVMTMYLVWEMIEQGKASLDDEVTVSKRADGTGGSTMNLKAGENVSIRKLMQGMAVASGNDACVAIAEHFGGLQDFVAQMNKKAKALGMHDTTFKNPHGLPAKGQLTTARDQLVLGLAYLKRFPKALSIHKKKSITHNKYTRRNSNRMLGTVAGVDGLKTGFVRASGFNIIVTAKRNGRRMVAVVLGGTSWRQRNKEATYILDACYSGKQRKVTITADATLPKGWSASTTRLASASGTKSEEQEAQVAVAPTPREPSPSVISEDADMAVAAALVAAHVQVDSQTASPFVVAASMQPLADTTLPSQDPPASSASAKQTDALAEQIVASHSYEIRGKAIRPLAMATVRTPRNLPQPTVARQGVYYSIQESSWKDKKGAKKRSYTLRDKGLEARVVTVQLKEKGTWHRVVIGAFPELEAARDYRTRMKTAHAMDHTLIIQMDANMEASQASR